MSSVPAEAADHDARLLILDANILIRAVLGRRVVSLLQKYATSVSFATAAIAYADVERHLPAILVGRGLPLEEVTRLVQHGALRWLPSIVVPVPEPVYADLEAVARERLKGRDEADWHFVALALKFGCPIWTEDQDFFGTGVATWTTDRVEIYLSGKG